METTFNTLDLLEVFYSGTVDTFRFTPFFSILSTFLTTLDSLLAAARFMSFNDKDSVEGVSVLDFEASSSISCSGFAESCVAAAIETGPGTAGVSVLF